MGAHGLSVGVPVGVIVVDTDDDTHGVFKMALRG